MEQNLRFQSINFFRSKLINLTTKDEIDRLVGSYDQEREKLRDQIHELMWYMRGSVTREDAWNLSFKERASINELIEERIKTVEKTKMPLL